MKNVRWNTVVQVGSALLSKLGDQLANPGIVLPWLFSALGVPIVLSGLLVPLRRVGVLLPQLGLAHLISRFKIRKWVWVGAAVGQGLALVLLGVFALAFQGTTAGVLMLAALLAFSLIRGFASLSFKDVLAKTIPQGKRGKVLGARSAAGGLISLAAGIFIILYLKDLPSAEPYILLIFAAALAFGASAAIFALIKEPAGRRNDGAEKSLETILRGLELFKKDRSFLHLNLSRLFLLTVRLSLPFYALYIKESISGKVATLGLIFVANSLAQVIGSTPWGFAADRSSRKSLMGAGLLGTLVPLLMIGLTRVEALNEYLLAGIVFLAGFSKVGIKVSRKTYLVDFAPDEKRPLYVGTSNSAMGLLVMAGSLFGLIAQFVSFPVLFTLFAALTFAGVLFAARLPEIADRRRELSQDQPNRP